MKHVFDAVASVFRKRPLQQVIAKGEIVDIYGRPVKDALEYFYPKQITGIPVFSVDSIYNHYKDLVKEVKKNSGIGEHRSDNGVAKLDYLFTEVIKRYIEYIHMLPASENHHHSTPGGMIVHSLESSAHAQKFAKENKPESLGMQDLDRQSLPIFRYAAWLATFMHDAGKVLRDIVVDAVEVEDGGMNVRVSTRTPIPSWQPQKESLISWAKRFNVATYSVTYVKDRVHNQHNVDSVQLLQPVLGNGQALEFLLSSPADVHSKLVRVLAGHDNGKDYIASSVRRGDMLSTSRNVAQMAGSTFLTEQSLSAPAKIYKAMKMAKQDWSYNTMNADVWVIGGEVYLRYAKAFHSIIKTANKNDLTIPNDLSVVTMLMEESGITEAFDTQHKSVKFVQGQYSDKELDGMLTGKHIVQWMELVKVKWKGLLFGDEPMPDSECGVFYFPEKKELVEVTAIGEFKPFSKSTSSQPQTSEQSSQEKGGPAQSPDSDTATSGSAPPQYDEQNPPPPTEADMPPESVQEERKTSNAKPNVKKVIEEAKKQPKKPKPTLNFVNAKVPDKNQPDKKTATPEDKQTTNVESSQSHTNEEQGVQANNNSTDANVDAPKETAKKPTKSAPAQEAKSSSTGAPDILAISKHVKLHSSKQQPGVFIAIDEALAYLKVTDKAQATKALIEAGIVRMENDMPVVVLDTVDGKRQQMIGIHVVEPSRADNTQEVAKKTQDKPVQPKRKRRKKPAVTENKSKQDASVSGSTEEKPAPKSQLEGMVESATEDTEQVADYGLAMRVSNARKGSLAYYIKLVFDTYEDNADKRDFVIEEGEQIALNATRLIEEINKHHNDANYQLRHIIKQCKSAGVAVERKQIGRVNYIQLDCQAIQEVDIEVKDER